VKIKITNVGARAATGEIVPEPAPVSPGPS
jgi:hypothetical protein